MKGEIFSENNLKNLWRPEKTAGKLRGGQVTIIGGSELFHGAPILALKAASRIVDMVYFASPKESKPVADRIKASLSSFIWIPYEDLESYIAKSEAVLIGPGLMRYKKEKGIDSGAVCDDEGKKTKVLSERLFEQFPEKKWVIDGGSLQVMDPRLIPKGAILTPNKKEFMMLFSTQVEEDIEKMAGKVAEEAAKYNCVIALKGPVTIVAGKDEVLLINGGSPGLIKGGTGDIVAGLAAAFLAKNEPVLAAAAANLIVKRAGEELEKERGLMFNADDVAEQVPKTWGRLINA